MGRVATRQKHELQNLLTRVLCGEVVNINKTYLLTLLGRERQRAEAWKDLLEIYEDIGGDGENLYGTENNGFIMLAAFQLEAVTVWSGK